MAEGLIDVQINMKQLKAVNRTLKDIPGGLKKVMPRALSKAAASVRTMVVKGVTGKYKIKSKDARDELYIKKAQPSRWESRVKITRKGKGRLSLMYFGAKPMKKGVKYMITKGDRKLIPSAFITTMKSGHEGVFIRKDKSRLPVSEKKGVSINEAFMGSPKLVRSVNKESRVILEKYIKAQVGILIEKKTRRVG